MAPLTSKRRAITCGDKESSAGAASLQSFTRLIQDGLIRQASQLFRSRVLVYTAGIKSCIAGLIDLKFYPTNLTNKMKGSSAANYG